MKQTTEIKIQLTILLLVLIAASIACKYPDAVGVLVGAAIENCFPVSRSQYESSAEQIGAAPEIPKYPDSAVYEVCQVQGQPVSVRMVDGEAPEDNESTGNAGNDSIPAGTYTGEFYFNEDHSDTTELMANEINVNISNSGIVNGSAILQFNNTYISDDLCTHYTEKGASYTISGQIKGVDKETVEVNKSTYFLSDHSPCGDTKRSDEECSCEGVLTVSDGELKIRCGSNSDCGVVLFAKR